MNASEPVRRTDIDWLRILATYLLFPFHVAMVFNPAPFYHVRNDELSLGMLVFAGFISLWHMPLFFLLAGWSIVASLRARGDGGFLRERLQRLGIPLLVGSTLLMPVIKYLELSSGLDLNHRGLFVSPALQEGFRRVIPEGLPVAAPFHETFWQFLPTFYARLDRFTWAHLWFVAYLLTFTLLYRPFVTWLLRRDGKLPPLRSAWVYVPVLPLAVVQLVLRPHWPGIQNLYDDWANVGYYSVFLLAGVLLARFPALEAAVAAERKRALLLALTAMGVLLLAVLGIARTPAVLLVGSAVAGWCFVVALVGFARRVSLPDGPALAYLAESAFPVYVLHQLAIVVIGYRLIQLPVGIAPKFTMLLVASLAATMAVYHWIVRPFPVLRFALGMKPRVWPLPRRALPRAAAVALFVLASGASSDAVGASPVGRWYAEGGAAQVEIRPCGPALCGEVVWLRSPFDDDGCQLRDRWNPDPALRARPVIGLDILRGLVRAPDGPSTWGGGTIYDPASGRTYRATLTLEGEDRAALRGYVGVPLLGRTTTWIRVGSEERLCGQGSGAGGVP